MTELNKKAIAAIEKYNMIQPGQTVVAAVSGGADSMALLWFLHTHRGYFGIEVEAAHVNHGIRGAESDADEQYVAHFCAEHSIPFFRTHVDVPGEMKKTGESEELCARWLRYEFLQTAAKGKLLATAHTNSDSVETFLFRFARGTGSAGLAGIPPVRDTIIRPLLFCTRSDTEAYCEENRIAYRTDSTNLSDAHARNRIRKYIVPVLEGINGGFERNAFRCMQTLRAENEYLQTQAETEYCRCTTENGTVLSKKSCLQLHPVIQSRVARLFLMQAGVQSPEYAHTERILRMQNGEIITLPGDIRFFQNNLEIRVLNTEKADTLCPVALPESDSELNFSGKHIRVSYSDSPVPLKKGRICVDADTIGAAFFRGRQDGDRLRLKRRGCTKTGKQLFEEMKVPVGQRPSWPVLADELGVIWIFGCDADESRLPDNNTTHFLVIEGEREQ